MTLTSGSAAPRPRLLQKTGISLFLMSSFAIGPQYLAAAPAPSKITQSAAVSREKEIDAIFKEWNSPNTPGASVAVIQHGKIVFEKGYGIANLEYNIPIRPDTIFHVASVSKQFTAMAVVLLELDGKLSIDDDVHKYLPELPDYGTKITLRNLLQHTSGIRDQWQILGLAGWDIRDVITQDQALRMIFRQKELNFPPGTRNLYSNAGFTLLAEIVTRVSGMPFPQFCAERIFSPLHMTHTHFHQDLAQLVPGRAYSYGNKGAGFEAAPSTTPPWAPPVYSPPPAILRFGSTTFATPRSAAPREWRECKRRACLRTVRRPTMGSASLSTRIADSRPCPTAAEMPVFVAKSFGFPSKSWVWPSSAIWGE